MNRLILKVLISNSLFILTLTIALIAILFFFILYRDSVNTSILGISQYKNSIVNNENPIFVEIFPRVVIENLWMAYSEKIQKDGRTIDRSRDYLTTSEGQSYSLLRAVWMDDKRTFDKVWKWTENNLQKRGTDNLFAWKWGKNPNGNWDILYNEGGVNSASDADQDIALALIFAGKRWNDNNYFKEASGILRDIWDKEVLIINDKPYLLAGNWAKEEKYPTVNPSYFSFAAYPIFASVDKEHPWVELVETSYYVLEQSTTLPLDKEYSAGIPPDWLSIDKDTTRIYPPYLTDKTTNFSDDAVRIPWRVALDWEWHKNPLAKIYLEKHLSFFENQWNRNNQILSAYQHNGIEVLTYQSNSLYGSIIPAFQIIYPDTAYKIYKTKLAPLYDSDIESFKDESNVGYYDQNWIWFGLALYNKQLPNLYTEIP